MSLTAETEKSPSEKIAVSRLAGHIVSLYCSFTHTAESEAFHRNFEKAGASPAVLKSLKQYEALASISGVAWNYAEGYNNSIVDELRDEKRRDFVQWVEVNPRPAFDASKNIMRGKRLKELEQIGVDLGFMPPTVGQQIEDVDFSSTGKSTSKTEPRGIEALAKLFGRR